MQWCFPKKQGQTYNKRNMDPYLFLPEGQQKRRVFPKKGTTRPFIRPLSRNCRMFAETRPRERNPRLVAGNNVAMPHRPPVNSAYPMIEMPFLWMKSIYPSMDSACFDRPTGNVSPVFKVTVSLLNRAMYRQFTR